MNTQKLCVVFLLFTGCFECRNDDCPGNDRFNFKILDLEGRSLIGTSNSIQPLENDSIDVIGIRNDESFPVNVSQRMGTLFITPSNSFEFYIIEYSFAKNDTLNFDLTFYNDDCCSNVVTEFKVEVNSSETPISSLIDSTFVFIK